MQQARHVPATIPSCNKFSNPAVSKLPTPFLAQTRLSQYADNDEMQLEQDKAGMLRREYSEDTRTVIEHLPEDLAV